MTSGPPQGRWANVDDKGEDKLGALPSSHSAVLLFTLAPMTTW